MTQTNSQFVQAADGRRIAYRVYGQGEPTVFLSNGIGCNQAYVDHVIQALAQRYRTVIWDYRAHVDSEPPERLEELTVDTCIRDMRAVAQAIGAQRTVLAGFSMGVQIGLEYLARYPEGVEGFIALLGTYEYPLRSFFHMGRAGEVVIPGLLKLFEARPGAFQPIWHAALAGPLAFPAGKLLVLNAKAAKPADFESWRHHLADMDARHFLALGKSLGAHSAAHALPLLGDLACLVVAGDRDNFTPLPICRRLHERTPGSEWFVIPGGSHGGLFEFPELVNPRVLQFMEQRFS